MSLDLTNPDMIVVYSDLDHACVADKDGRYTCYDKADRWETEAARVLAKGGKVIVVRAEGDIEESQMVIDFISDIVTGKSALEITSQSAEGPGFEIKQDRSSPILCTVLKALDSIDELADYH